MSAQSAMRGRRRKATRLPERLYDCPCCWFGHIPVGRAQERREAASDIADWLAS